MNFLDKIRKLYQDRRRLAEGVSSFDYPIKKKKKTSNRKKFNSYSSKEEEYKKQKPCCRSNGKIGH